MMHIIYMHYKCNYKVFTDFILTYIINVVNKKMLK